LCSPSSGERSTLKYESDIFTGHPGRVNLLQMPCILPLHRVLLKGAKTWTIVKPKPIRAVAERTQDISVRSVLMWVRSQKKCVSTVGHTANLGKARHNILDLSAQ
jgi:hypothetical protein